MRILKYAILALMMTPFAAIAGNYPDKQITMICPYSAGGGGDTVTRMIAKLAGDIMGVKINVENKTGGGATIGIGAVSKSKPDGYTIGFVSTSPITIRPHMMKAPYHPLKDLTYIGQFIADSQPLVVLKDSPHKSLKDLISFAKANPGNYVGQHRFNVEDHMWQLKQCLKLKAQKRHLFLLKVGLRFSQHY